MQHILIVTDVSGQPIGPIFKSQAVQYLDCLILEDGTDRLSRNVGNYQFMLRNIPEDPRSHLHDGGSLKSRIKGILISRTIIRISTGIYRLTQSHV
jgi:hypothetical protein